MNYNYILIEKNKETGKEKEFLTPGVSLESAKKAKELREFIRQCDNTLQKYDIYIKEI